LNWFVSLGQLIQENLPNKKLMISRYTDNNMTEYVLEQAVD